MTRAGRFPYASLLAFFVSLWPWAGAKDLVPLPPVSEARAIGWGLSGAIALLLVFVAYFFERRASRPLPTQVLFGLGLLLSVPPTIVFLLLVFFIGAIAGMF
jgi:hypothetical protein